MSRWLIFIKKIWGHLQSPWVDSFIRFISFLQAVVWIFGIIFAVIFWIHKNQKKIKQKLLPKFRRVWNTIKRVTSERWNKAKEETLSYIEELKRELESRRGGNLNNSVLLYQAGSHIYGYERLDESRQNDIYWLGRVKQADEWTNWQIAREKLVDQVSCDFNLKRDEKRIKKYFRPAWRIEMQLRRIEEEIKEVTSKSFCERSEEQQKRFGELYTDKERLKTELYYSKKFFIIC